MDLSGVKTLGDYVLERRLGAGEGTAVYVGRHSQLGVRHAIKVLRLSDPEHSARFAREAQALAKLDQHEGVVRVFRYEILENGLAYFAFDLIEGQSLQEALREGQTVPLDQTLRMGEAIARALGHVHEAGIVHHDLGLSSVLLSGPHRKPVLTGFGFARDSSAQRLTATGVLVGGKRLLAPEQVRSEERIGSGADVFALGGLLFRLLTGAEIFGERTLAEVSEAIVKDRIPAPSSLRPEVPKVLDDLVLRCMSKSPSKRPTAVEVADTLRGLARQGVIPPAVGMKPLRVAAVCTCLAALTTFGILIDRRLERRALGAEREAQITQRFRAALSGESPADRLEALEGFLVDHPEDGPARALARATRAQAALIRFEESRASPDGPRKLARDHPANRLGKAARATSERAARGIDLVGALRPLDVGARDEALGEFLDRYPDEPLARSARAEIRPWVRLQLGVTPPSRYYHAMAYDAARGEVVLFGGSNGKQPLNDTWVFDGRSWTKQSPEISPSPRGAHAMAYDSARQVVVLFGGQDIDEQLLGDTWEWDGDSWSERQGLVLPPPRRDPALVYDARRNRVLLFGGYGSTEDEARLLDDTWLWNGSSWEEADTGEERPSARFEHALVYDGAREQVLLQGGKSRWVLSKTWTWDGSRWKEHGPRGPELTAHALAYDAGRDRVVAVGGGETWEWDGKGWSQRDYLGGPDRLEEHVMVFDQRRGVLVLFGGKQGTALQSATWELSAKARD